MIALIIIFTEWLLKTHCIKFVKMYQLDEPIYFYILFLIPFIWTFLLFVFMEKTQKQFISSKMLEKLSPEESILKVFKINYNVIGIISISFGLVNPKIGTKLETVKEGVDIVFAIDVSKSMLTEDIARNRIEKAKRLVSALLNQLVSDSWNYSICS